MQVDSPDYNSEDTTGLGQMRPFSGRMEPTPTYSSRHLYMHRPVSAMLSKSFPQVFNKECKEVVYAFMNVINHIFNMV